MNASSCCGLASSWVYSDMSARTTAIRFWIDLISDEALKTSAIEGEFLNRDSLQSSLRQQLGLAGEAKRVSPAERGIVEMMVDVYLHFADPLSHRTLYSWHKMVMSGHRDIERGRQLSAPCRTMRVVSGRVDEPKVHFEALPSPRVKVEMDAFIAWFNDSRTDRQVAAPGADARRNGSSLLREHPPLRGRQRAHRTRAVGKGAGTKPGRAELDSSGVHDRARQRKRYYDTLEASNKDNAITPWLVYFAKTVLEAQQTTLARVEFSVAKARFCERLRDQLNERQEKVIVRMFRARASMVSKAA